MSYCVNCGVELAKSEKACPLCGVVVSNPLEPWREGETRPYPTELEQVSGRVNRRFGAYLATIVLAIPLVVTTLLDILDNGMPRWSPYVLGAGAVLFTVVLLPFYAENKKPYFYLAFDGLVIALYLTLIGFLSGGMAWVVPLALPITVTLVLGILTSTWLARRAGKKILNLLGDIALITGFMAVIVETAIDQYLWKQIHLTWSLYTLIPLAAIWAVFRLIEKREDLKSKIFRRLFW